MHYDEASSLFYHEFTFEMPQAVFQLICLDSSVKARNITANYLEFPPVILVLEQCKNVTQMKSMHEYKWGRRCYSHVGASTTLATEIQWKATDVEQWFMQDNPN